MAQAKDQATLEIAVGSVKVRMSHTPGSAVHGTREDTPDRDRARRREHQAVAAAEQWKAEHPKAAAQLEPADVLVDRMRGSSRCGAACAATWNTFRPKAEQPRQGVL